MNDDLHSFIEPELEARIVALILGEASAFEQEELERIMAERPEVGLWKQRLEAVHGLVGEASKPAEMKGWTLSDARRNQVLSVLKEEAVFTHAPEKKEKRIGVAQRRALLSLAACVMVAFILVTFYVAGSKTASVKSESFAVKREVDREDQDRMLQELADHVDDKKKALTVLTQQYGISYFDGRSSNPVGMTEEQMYQNAQQRLDQLKGKNSQIEEKLANLEKSANLSGSRFTTTREAENLRTSLETQKKLVTQQIDRMEETVLSKKGNTVDLSIRQHEYTTAREEYEQSRALLREARLQVLGTGENGKVGRGLNIADEAPKAREPISSESALAQIGDAMVSHETGFEDDFDGVTTSNLSTLTNVRDGGLQKGLPLVGQLPVMGQLFKTKEAIGYRWSDKVGTESLGEDSVPLPKGAPIVIPGIPAIASEDSDPFSSEPTAYGRRVVRKPTAPASSMSKVIASATAKLQKVDVPAQNHLYAYSAMAPKIVGLATAGNRSGDFSINSDDVDGMLNENLSDGAVTLSQQNRRAGKYKEARDLLTETQKADSENEDARKQLAYLDDPIRTNLALGNGNAKNTDQVRSSLDQGAELYDLGLYDKAEEHFHNVLRTDPYNKAARRWLERTSSIKANYYRAAYDESRARMIMEVDKAWELSLPPVDDSTVKNAPLSDADVDEVKRSLYLGEGNYDLGIYDKAEEHFHNVLKTDPQNKAARRWLERTESVKSDYYRLAIDENRARMLGEVDKAWELQLPSVEGKKEVQIRTSSIEIRQNNLEELEPLGEERLVWEKVMDDPFADDGGGGSAIAMKSSEMSNKLREIIIPELNLEDATLEEALEILSKEAAKHDSTALAGLGGVSLSQNRPRITSDDDGFSSLGEFREAKIDSLNMTNVPLGVALQYVAEKARMRYKVDENGVTFLPINSSDGEDVVTRRFAIPEGFEEFITSSTGGGEDDPFASPEEDEDEQKKTLTTKELFKQQGVKFSEGASVNIINGMLIVRNSPTQLELIDAIVNTAEKNEKQLKKEEAARQQVEKVRQNFETLTSQKTDSTFSLNVSDVSFKLAKAALAEGQWPDASKVRPEEFVNALDFGDSKPSQAEKVACVIEQGSHPFMQQRNLMRVSLSTAALGRNASTPLRLTILLDQSGSMERNDRAESVRRAFDLLAAQLTAADEVTLVGFARTPRLLAERMKGDECAKLSQIVRDTPTEGGTNLEEALTAGLQLAKQQFVENAQNRIILLTDGAANLGDALPETLAGVVEKMRRAGIAFDACGVGADGFNDDILSALTKQGDGRYYFLDRPEDADEGFARQIAGALRPAARNVKVQVIFNPERVERFKLYGYEKHQLKKEDFRNDSVDAAEMAAEESGVALYHYQAMPQGRGDVGTVSVRFQDVASGQMVERTWNIPYEEETVDFTQAEPGLRLASAAALFGEKLKGSVVGERVELGALRRMVDGLRGEFGEQRRFEELRTMIQQAGK